MLGGSGRQQSLLSIAVYSSVILGDFPRTWANESTDVSGNKPENQGIRHVLHSRALG